MEGSWDESQLSMPRPIWRACVAVSAVYHLLRNGWWEPATAAKVGLQYCVEAEMSPESLHNLLSMVLGFAVAGLFTSGYRLFTDRLPGLELLATGPSAQAFAAVPVLMFAAPFLIMRNTILGSRQDGRRFQFVFVATMISGFWSLMSGMIVAQVVGLLLA